MSLRTRVEQRSAVLLVLLAPRRRLLFGLALGLLLVSVVVPQPLHGLLLLPVLLLFAWLAYLSWPALDLPGRALRVGALLLLVLVALR